MKPRVDSVAFECDLRSVDHCSALAICNATQTINERRRRRLSTYLSGHFMRTALVLPGNADYCVYWFRRAHDELKPCDSSDPLAGRAGLVGTQNIRSNASRIVSDI